MRISKGENTQMAPQPVSGETGLVILDTSWEKFNRLKLQKMFLP